MTKYALRLHRLEVRLSRDISYTAEDFYDLLRDQNCLDPVEEGEFDTEEEGRAALANAQPRTILRRGTAMPYLDVEIYELEKIVFEPLEDGDRDYDTITTIGYRAEPYVKEAQ